MPADAVFAGFDALQVSQTWASLALDGQLWQKVDVPLLGADVFARGALMRIIRSAGPFITELNLRGLASLDPTGVFDVIEHCATYMPDTGHETGLVSLCLTGAAARRMASAWTC